MKKLITIALVLMLSSCSSYYEEDIKAFSEQELKALENINARGALKEGTFHMQPVSSSSPVRVIEKVKLKKPNLPPYEVVYIQTDLEDILLELGNSSGENILIPQSARGRKITLSHSGANFQEMLDIVLSKAGYSYNYVNGIWNVTRYPVRTYSLEIGQSDRSGSLDTSEISGSSSSSSSGSSDSGSSDSGSSDSSGSSGGDLETTYDDKLWEEVDNNLEKLIEFGNFKTNRVTIKTNEQSETTEETNLGNNFSIIDTENKEETTASVKTLKSSEVIIDDDNIEPWFNITKSAGMITVRAAPEAHNEIEKYLEMVQESLHRQIFVEVRIIGLTENKETAKGIQWAIDGIFNAGFTPASQVSESQLSGGFLKFTKSNIGLDGIIQNLSTITDVQTISTPQILVRNNQVGYVKILDELAYITTATETETTDAGTFITRTDTIENKDVGTILSVMPYIGKNKVQMRLRLSVSQQSGSIKTLTSTAGSDPITNDVPTVSSNVIDQDMIVNYGRVYALGGYVEDKRETSNSQVPGFHNIPGISELMQKAKNSGSKTRFIIFIKVNRA
ncbi:MAG: hypothetical protein GY793_09570 [Proteobacteria bacterium]|nr:hypothetical protein [Pseudomonadota bacterium]